MLALENEFKQLSMETHQLEMLQHSKCVALDYRHQVLREITILQNNRMYHANAWDANCIMIHDDITFQGKQQLETLWAAIVYLFPDNFKFKDTQISCLDQDGTVHAVHWSMTYHFKVEAALALFLKRILYYLRLVPKGQVEDIHYLIHFGVSMHDFKSYLYQDFYITGCTYYVFSGTKIIHCNRSWDCILRSLRNTFRTKLPFL